MAKGGNSLNNKRSRNAKPYDANNSFVKKVATKVTDLIPQRSWISKWFNSSQDNGDMLNDEENLEGSENEQESQQPPPSKRPRIRMDVTHPPGTFNIQPRSRIPDNEEVDPRKEDYIVHNETTTDFLEPSVAGTSGVRRLVASTPAIQSEIGSTSNQRNRTKFISLTSPQNNGTANGTDDNSESSESTSGCSSLIPQVNRQEAPSSLGYNRSSTNRKRYNEDKLNYTNHLQSPRSLFLDSNPRDSLSSRKPSFNVSIMNNSLERGQSSSPFYNGNTTFGGANMAGFQRRGRTLFNSTNELQLKVPNRTNIQVKSPNVTGTDSSAMSQTAKRILEALEHFSSPILDAKKIPMNANNSSSLIGGRKRQREEGCTPLARVGLRHLTRELTVPTVPDLLKLRRRQRLQDTTVAARRIVSARSAPPPSPQEYRLRSDDEEKSKYSGKVKSKGKTDLDQDYVTDAVNLPSVTLPISTLPTFDIKLPVITSNMAKGVKDELFKFSSPIKVTDTTRNLKSINNFTFSKPINASVKESAEGGHSLSRTLSSESDTLPARFSSSNNFMWSKTSTAPKLKEKPKEDVVVDGIKTSSKLKTGSVMDVLGKKSDLLTDANKPVVGMWECNQCLLKNNQHEPQCIGCKASKSLCKSEKTTEHTPESSPLTVTQSKPVTTDCFGSQFKMSGNHWECPNCATSNKQTDVKCTLCAMSKSESIKAPTIGSTSSIVPESVKSDLMEKFKPPEGSWECPGCMLRNHSSVETCPCCNASKPGSLKISPKRVPATSELLTTISNPGGNQLANNTDSVEKTKSTNEDLWECLKCKQKNSRATLICPCFSTSKSDSTSTPALGFGDKFKKPEGAWTCDDCMVQNKADVIECVACSAVRPGSKKVAKSTSATGSGSNVQFSFGVPENAGGFKFGIDKSDEKVDANKPVPSSTGFTFGAKTDSPKAGGFTFGVPQNSSGFTFGVVDNEKNKLEQKSDTKETDAVQNVSKKRSLNVEEPKNQAPFSFGIPKTEEAKSSPEKQFAFGAQPVANTSTKQSFSFGAVKTEAPVNKKDTLPEVYITVSNTESQKLNFSAPTSDAPTAILANDQSSSITTKLSINTDITKSAENPTFGTINVPVSLSSGSTVTTTAASVPTPGLFTFGSATTIPNQPTTVPSQVVQSFGQIPVSAPTSVPTPSMFVFGSTKQASTIAATTHPDKSEIVSFGSTNSPAFNAITSAPRFEGNENKQAPSFGMTDNKPAPLFGAGETKAPVFGAAQDNNKMIPAFGSIKKTASTSVFNSTTPAFGASSSTPAFGTAAPAFGTTSTPAFGTNPTPSIFGTSKPVETAPSSTSGLFAFGGSSTQPSASQASSGFNFSQNPTPASVQPMAQKSLFAFGNTSTNTQQSDGTGFGAATNFNPPAASDTTAGTFVFNTPKPDAAPPFSLIAPTSTSIFGTPQAAPTFGQSQSTSAFGSVAPTPNAGFNFGGSATPAPSGFNFGGAATAAAPTGGFPFNAPNSNQGVAFNPNTPPTFNFTGGSAPTAFNAVPQTIPQATTQATPQRKFKKAVRRTQPR
ncbi:nuclear pore complex protein Nup153 [Neodiprion virginianus]|uniref:nuclear pore complex protein Nup153 n=1 Tax=Neodiprion virginianus TaxID=2961670 RepID=UPI001EE6BC7C|nr:nuclear pore complex protein Nup153 [Neodiprion virginianus]XP_046605623.1 nuclear pore complex protein Nup153 [Neodiprion virginianus]